jgi:prephenate dehydrogenase
MSPPKTVAVIGLGLIGGSVARGLATCGVRILGYDADPLQLDAAISDEVVSEKLSAGLEDLGGADAVVIAVDGDSAVDVLNRLALSAAAVQLVTDVGSTKQTIVAAAERLGLESRFVGSHPFAGDHRSGWAASCGDLFENATVYLCPAEGATESALAYAKDLWASLSATPVVIDPAAHDELMAWASHLPHLVSTALALALSEAGITRRKLGRGGRDMTRLAGGSPEVWTAIATDNAERIESAVASVERQLGAFRQALMAHDREALRARFESARDWSDPAQG